MLPQDEDTRWTIELPEVRPAMVKLPAPVREITVGEGDTVAHADMIPAPDSDLCEYFPVLKRRKAAPLGGADAVDDEDEDVVAAGELTIVDSEGLPVRPDTGGIDEHDLDNDDHTTPIDGLPCCDPGSTDDHLPPAANPPDRERSLRRKRSSRRKGGKRHTPRVHHSTHDDAGMVDVMDDDLAVDVAPWGLDSESSQLLEEQEAQHMRDYAVVSDGRMTFSRICKKVNAHFHELPFELHHVYRLWLLTKPRRGDEPTLYVEDLPKALCESRTPLRAGLTFPYPSGPHWARLKSDTLYRREQGERVFTEDREEEQ